MTSASGWRREMLHAFSIASAIAQLMAESPARRASTFKLASSIAAGSTMNATPAARSNPARAALAEARINASVGAAMPPHQQLMDRRCSFLDRAARHVDDRPMMLGKGAPRLAHLGTDRLDIGVVGRLVMVEHAEPAAPQVDQPLGVVRQPDNQ